MIASFNRNTMKEHTAVKEESIREPEKSRVDYEALEGWVRGRMQELIQELLEEEVEELLGRVDARIPVSGNPAVLFRLLPRCCFEMPLSFLHPQIFDVLKRTYRLGLFSHASRK